MGVAVESLPRRGKGTADRLRQGGVTAMWVLHAIGRALGTAGSMTKQITWSLILGFTSSAVVEAVIRRETIPQRLGDGPGPPRSPNPRGSASRRCRRRVPTPRGRTRGCCSGRGQFYGCHGVFKIASTNLVIELGVILALSLGWQFTLPLGRARASAISSVSRAFASQLVTS